MECYAIENCENPRKKPRREDTWSRSIAKKQRYGPTGPPKKPASDPGLRFGGGDLWALHWRVGEWGI